MTRASAWPAPTKPAFTTITREPGTGRKGRSTTPKFRTSSVTQRRALYLCERHFIYSHQHHLEKIINITKQGGHPATLQRHVLVVSMAAALSLIAVEQVRAATPDPAKVAAASPGKPARQCLNDLSTFQVRLQKEGYWRGSSSYGYGYPMYGYAYEEAGPPPNNTGAAGGASFWRARPGYEIRTLLASAQILAQRGQQQPCEALLSATRDIYNRYAGEMRSSNGPRNNAEAWRRDQLASARPVASSKVSYRSDQLIGTEVLSPKGDTLGSVEDMVLSPHIGKLAYLVIGRGGLFGIDEKYVPVPWPDFKATADAKLLVLDATKADRFSAGDNFAKQIQQVDAYWAAHPAK